jgi:hypothetical protein
LTVERQPLAMVSTLSCAATGLTASIHQPRGCQSAAPPQGDRRSTTDGSDTPSTRAALVPRPRLELLPKNEKTENGLCQDDGRHQWRCTVQTHWAGGITCCNIEGVRAYDPIASTKNTTNTRTLRTRKTEGVGRDHIGRRIRRAAGEASRWTTVDSRVRECDTDGLALSYAAIHCRPRGPAARARRYPLLTTPTTHSDRQLPPEGGSHVASGLAGRYSIHAVL